ncbi:MAG: ATP synthase F1 subunit epsilon [Candidatus Komeilibacteria bacterium]|nr:ATP synthase F1 subunit epsilon [Candidatus Komeilibacteria bacterium]
MKKLSLKIVTPERILLDEEVQQVSLATAQGQITVLPGHTNLIAKLAPGEVMIKQAGVAENLIAISGGLVEVLPGLVIVLADTAERAVEIDEARAEAARQRAEELRHEKLADAEEFARLTAMIEKEMTRVRVARKYKQMGIRSGHIDNK